MSDKEIMQRVVKVTSRVLGLDPDEITPDANFIFDLGAESSQSVELVLGFEAEFGIDMDQEKALAVQTVAGAADFIGQHLKAG
jgi:acyl carrier protein